jgi:hypothetical protein
MRLPRVPGYLNTRRVLDAHDRVVERSQSFRVEVLGDHVGYAVNARGYAATGHEAEEEWSEFHGEIVSISCTDMRLRLGGL